MESGKDSHTEAPPKLDLNEIEMVFGKPMSPNVRPDILIENEKNLNNNTHNNTPGNLHRDTNSKQPLLEPDKPHQTPPLAGPEIDDLDDIPHDDSSHFPGIDDGLLEPENKEGKPHDKDGDKYPEGNGSHSTHVGDGTDDGKWLYPATDETDFPYDYGANGLGSRFGGDDRPISPIPGSSPDVNTYQQKKNLAQGMMDLALLSANANQLRYVIEAASSHAYYYPSLTFITLSIILQIAVGVGLIMNSRYNVTKEEDICKADKINNFTVLGVFLITIVNVFITSFSVATPAAIGSAVVAASSGTG